LIGKRFIVKTKPPILIQVQSSDGQEPRATELTTPNPVSKMYYTLDGSDPRLPGGGINPAATVLAPSQEQFFEHGGEGDLVARIHSERNGWSPSVSASGLRLPVGELQTDPALEENPDTGTLLDATEIRARQIELATDQIAALDRAIRKFRDKYHSLPVGEELPGDHRTDSGLIDILTGRNLELNPKGNDFLLAK